MGRIGLFLATNFAVITVFGFVLSLLGVDQAGMLPLLIFASIFGMGGAFVSLWMSKSGAIRSTGAQLIENPRNSTERWLVDTVAKQAEAAGIGMPDVAVFQSAAPNAFATGAKRDDALVAVSTGLLQHMSEDEIEAVLAHEVSHVANGDMVTLTLLQGVLNTFVMVFATLIASALDRNRSGGSYGRGAGYYLGYMVAQMVLGILASIIVAAFSRYREYRADAGGAKLASREKMISALARLQEVSNPGGLPDSMAAFGISGGGLSLASLMASHPPLPKRIDALKEIGER